MNCLNNTKQDEQDGVIPTTYILLYEDNEGDRMLAGDVPWEYVLETISYTINALFHITQHEENSQNHVSNAKKALLQVVHQFSEKVVHRTGS